jgi:hypothetical protein
MGTWGPGNLDSDGALDEVAERSHALVEQLWRRLHTRQSWETDEIEYDALFVDFEIVFALEANGVFDGYALTQLENFEQVRDRWLAGWDDYIDRLERRSVCRTEPGEGIGITGEERGGSVSGIRDRRATTPVISSASLATGGKPVAALGPREGFKQRRRQVIEETFERFAGLYAKYRAELAEDTD